MAIIFSDGCDNYTSDSHLLTNWDDYHSSVVVTSSGGRFGGGSIGALSGTQREFLTKTFPELLGTPSVTGFFNFSFKYTDASETGNIIELFNSGSSSTPQLNLGISSGTLTLYRADNTFLANQTGSSLAANTWYHIEIMFVAHDTTGRFQMKVNGVDVFDFTGDTLLSAGVNNYSVLKFGMPSAVYDDFIIYTSTGDAPTTFFGDCKITTVRPTGAGNSSDSTAVGAASRHEAVDETVSDGDTTHVTLSANDDQDLYAMGDITGTPTVHAVVVKAVCRTDSSDVRTLQNTVRSSTTEAQGTSTTIVAGSAFKTIMHPFIVDPNTASAWTAAGVNAMEAGQKMSN